MATGTIGKKTPSSKDMTLNMAANSSFVSAQIGINFSRITGAMLLYGDDVYYAPPVIAISTSGTVNLRLASSTSTARTYTVRIFYI